jgi:glycosyltransferase involved in cell wall biosynthesis
VRGPHSRALQAWVGTHAADYDCILVQGIPFDVIPSTVENLTRLPSRPRVVTLPHFHGDDRFYYWSRYVESLSAADATLLFSSSIASRLGEGDPFTVVPGGGVRADDHGDPTAPQAFRAVHDTGRPFFLVLGRKTASKGYEEIIRAHRALRQAGTPVDLVMIGPDEDGRTVTADGVYYLGHQPRPVIRGALEACLGVVSMSRSESFGIVLCEAWLFGKPVIANRACYSFRELVRDGESGILVSSEAELCAAMVRLCSDPAERSRLGERGFIEVAERFSWERVAAACYAHLSSAESRVTAESVAPAESLVPSNVLVPQESLVAAEPVPQMTSDGERRVVSSV